jgi:hypothetical protein
LRAKSAAPSLEAAAPSPARGRRSFEDQKGPKRTNFDQFERTRPDLLSWNVKDLAHKIPFLIKELHGAPVMAWTVRTPTQCEACVRVRRLHYFLNRNPGSSVSCPAALSLRISPVGWRLS